jgi:hypothetical protein
VQATDSKKPASVTLAFAPTRFEVFFKSFKAGMFTFYKQA